LLRIKVMCQWASCNKKYEKKYFFATWKSLKKWVGSGIEILLRGTDPGIRIRTKMSRIPNTGSYLAHCTKIIFILGIRRARILILAVQRIFSLLQITRSENSELCGFESLFASLQLCGRLKEEWFWPNASEFFKDWKKLDLVLIFLTLLRSMWPNPFFTRPLQAVIIWQDSPFNIVHAFFSNLKYAIFLPACAIFLPASRNEKLKLVGRWLLVTLDHKISNKYDVKYCTIIS
jgi:hypothetical protein